MADNNMHNNFCGLPSPEELFPKAERTGKPVSAVWQEPIPDYRVVRRFSLIFLLSLLIIILILMNLDRFGIHCYSMMSGSMERVIPEGSFILEIETSVNKLETGDIITYTNDSGISITHEIINVIPDYLNTGQPAFETKGSENASADSELVTKEAISGKVIFHIPYIGKLLLIPKILKKG